MSERMAFPIVLRFAYFCPDLPRRGRGLGALAETRTSAYVIASAAVRPSIMDVRSR